MFPTNAISNGSLRVGEMKRKFLTLGVTDDTADIELSKLKMIFIFQGELLNNDSAPCREEGLKHNSMVRCVLSHEDDNYDTSKDLSEEERQRKGRR